MAKFPFLSDEWVEEARRIRAEYSGKMPAAPVAVRMNQVVKGVPFGEGTLAAHLDTSTGELDIETGHIESPDLTVTIDYETVRAIFVEGDPQVAMQAFFSGRIKVDGDISKLLTLQSSGMIGGIDPISMELAQRIQEITE